MQIANNWLERPELTAVGVEKQSMKIKQ